MAEARSRCSKDLPEIGDVHINGIVNVSGFMEYFVLQNTRLHLVMSMANVLAEGLQLTDKSEPAGTAQSVS